MKVFVPMSDSLSDQLPQQLVNENGEKTARLVPFNPEFLSEHATRQESSKPANWIMDSDYASACRRLFGQAQRYAGSPA